MCFRMFLVLPANYLHTCRNAVNLTARLVGYRPQRKPESSQLRNNLIWNDPNPPRFICSKAGGAPVVMEPSTAVESLSETPEGWFCFKLDTLAHVLCAVVESLLFSES